MPTQWSEAGQAPLGRIAPYATAPLAPLRRGRCPRSGAKRNKHPWGASPRIPPHPLRCSVGGDAHAVERSGTSTLGAHRPVCHGSAVASNLPLRGGLSKPPSVRWQREALTEGEPFTHHLLALSFRASDRCHWRGNPSPPTSFKLFQLFSTKSSQNPLPAFKFFQVFSR